MHSTPPPPHAHIIEILPYYPYHVYPSIAFDRSTLAYAARVSITGILFSSHFQLTTHQRGINLHLPSSPSSYKNSETNNHIPSIGYGTLPLHLKKHY